MSIHTERNAGFSRGLALDVGNSELHGYMPLEDVPSHVSLGGQWNGCRRSNSCQSQIEAIAAAVKINHALRARCCLIERVARKIFGNAFIRRAGKNVCR